MGYSGQQWKESALAQCNMVLDLVNTWECVSRFTALLIPIIIYQNKFKYVNQNITILFYREMRAVQFRIRNYIFTFNVRATKLEKCVMGIRSNLDKKSIYNGGLHILMLDADDVTKDNLFKGIMALQNKFKLGDAEISRSSIKTIYQVIMNKKIPFFHIKKKRIEKWHVYFFQDQLDYFQCVKIIHYATNVLKITDPAYSRWRGIRKNMVLRTSPKSNGYVPKFHYKVISSYRKPDIKWFKEYVYKMIEREQSPVEIKGNKILKMMG